MQMDLRLGADVRTASGERVGTLQRVLVDDAGDVEELIVHLHGLIEDLLAEPHEVRVPVSLVQYATERGVTVQATHEELERLPEYVSERALQPGERWDAPPGYTVSDLLSRLALLLGAGANQPPLVTELERDSDEHQIALYAPALAGDTQVGEVSRVLYDSVSGRVIALVLHRDDLDHELLLPAELLEAVADDAIQVRLAPDQITNLERFRP